MKAFSVIGVKGSGKTTSIENIIPELMKRGYSVGSIKEIHCEEFALDTEGSNTDRHKKAGAQLVTARGKYETDLLFSRRLAVQEILKFYADFDYVVMEGVSDTNVPKIITALQVEEIDKRMDETVIAISGRIANTMQMYKGLQVINAMTELEKLVDFLEEKVADWQPDVPEKVCTHCKRLDKLVI
ncbi:MAG: molybdopterin-guanine dinucleotide biosynthesis protein B [Firmicutes bacterium]|nr:molybdopterin-guanine dinucleotide biosynthesis protein B [Bacillota bacterium]